MAKNIGRNLLLSGVSWLVPSVVALIAVPITVHGLGVSAYGVVALAGAVTGYLYVLDLGLGQGFVRYLSMFVSLRHGKAMRRLIALVVVWFAVAGVLGAAVMWVLTPWLVSSLLKVPAGLTQASVLAFRLGGAAFGLGLIVSLVSLIPTAFLRYDLVTKVSVTVGTASLAGPAILVTLGYGLVPVMWFGVVANGVSLAFWAVIVARLIKDVPDEGPDLSEYWKGFLGFSLKNSINRIWSVIQTPTSQMVVGISGGVTAAAYFQVPMLISTKVTGLLYQMSTVLLPTGSQLAAEGENDQLLALYERSSRLFFVLNGSVVGAVAVFSAPLLGHWMGPEFARQGAVAFSLLTLAVGLNAVSMTASQVNMALGRPGVNLAFSLANSVINLATVYSLTVAFGITGTALSGLLAAAVVPFFLHYSHRRILEYSSWEVFRDCYLRTSIVVAVVSGLAWVVLRPLASGLLVTIILVGVTAGVSVLVAAAAGSVTREDWASLRYALSLRTSGGAPAAPVQPAAEDSADE
jgi:O-antigen/teichoic acid export membrane protein